MEFNSKTIKGFFASSQISYIIPVYQRAYSWEDDNWKTFLDDLKEQIKGENNYFYGNILLERVKRDEIYEIIDGQQRLTTLTIFIRSIIFVLSERAKNDSSIHINIEDKVRLYLKDNGIIKIRPVDYDQPCYDALIVDGIRSFETTSPSQSRIKEAKEYFIKELFKIASPDLLKILKKVEESEINWIELGSPKDAALMFELQNNRGKDLTNLERLKSYFMYEMYVYSKKEEIDSNINGISEIFKQLYSLINNIKLNEDTILIYHCNAYINGFNYRTLEHIKDVFKKSEDKVNWIKDFIRELYTTFYNIRKLENSEDTFLKKLRKDLQMPSFVYPFIIKGYKFFGDDAHKLSLLFAILEVAAFRFKLVNSRADFESRLNEILNSFNDDNLTKLRDGFKSKFNIEGYWSDNKIKDALNGWMYKSNVDNYIFWEYENFIQKIGYTRGSVEIIDEQIEHISPQNPKDGEPKLAEGYEVDANNHYDQDFLDSYLNRLGNLMLISPTHNKEVGNKPFKLKLDSYNSNPLLKQQAEIKTFVLPSESPKWDKIAIDTRHAKILDFALIRWSFDTILIPTSSLQSINITSEIGTLIPNIDNVEDEEDNEEEKTIKRDRKYWENKIPNDTLKQLDDCIDILKEIDLELFPSYLHRFIGVSKWGKKMDFVKFWLKKKFFRIDIRVIDLDSWLSKLNENGFDEPLKSKKKARLKFNISKNELKNDLKKREFLKKLFQTAYNEQNKDIYTNDGSKPAAQMAKNVFDKLIADKKLIIFFNKNPDLRIRSFPVLVDVTNNTHEEIRNLKNRKRYYADPIIEEGRTFLLCSQWYSDCLPILIKAAEDVNLN